MTVYRVVCVRKKRNGSDHKHIVSVGVTKDARQDTPDSFMSVARVRDAIDEQNVFLTIGPRTGRIALVEKLSCTRAGCAFLGIRSDPDPAEDNNLDDLDRCPGGA